MNHDIDTTKYLSPLKDLKLSEEAKVRLQNTLAEYTAFHSVRVDESNRLIEEVSTRSSLFSLKFAAMPFVIVCALLITGGTSFAAQGAVPGDFLYPIKITVNENVRAAFAVSNDSEAKLQANLLAERVEEAETLQFEGRLNGEVSQTVAANIASQTKVATAAAESSSVVVAAETKVKIEVIRNRFLAMADVDTGLTGDVSTAIVASDLATGLYDITAYKADMKARVKSLTNVMEKNQTKLAAGVYMNLNLKLQSATKLSAVADAQVETEARATLDEASALAGEVEAKLSTLGQVEIDPDTGIITDIDFSIDPMIIDRGDGSGNGIPTDPRAAQSGMGAGEIQIDVPVNIDAGAAVTGEATLGL